ncbi:MAG: lamin tail domain-containing protein, partial [Chloroflexota bacterium]
NHVADFDKQQAAIAASNSLPSTATPTASATSTATGTPTITATATPTSTPTFTPTVFPARAIVINEILWMGSDADSNDEWIELYNATGAAINLSGWTLTIDDGILPDDTVINLNGVIAAGGFFLLERTDDTTIGDIAADLIYTGSMSNDGRVLNLRDPTFTSIDTANGDGGAWPAGNSDLHASMERVSATAPDSDGNWSTNYGHIANGHDKNGGALRATPRQPNSNLVPTPTPTAFARFTSVRLNEVLPNAGPAEYWIEYGLTHTPGEYIELYNVGSEPVDIGYWMLDDGIGGSDAYVIPPGWMIYPGDYWFMYTKGLGLSFNDGGDSARLLYPDGSVIDEVSWTTSMKDDRSISRNAAGTGGWEFDWQPSPGMSNRPHAVGSRFGPKPTPIVVGLRLARTFSDGAWITLIGKVTGPYPLFGSRVIYVQDESGTGLAVYLGRGTWPPMQAGQSIQAVGYLRTRNGERELYVKNPWLFSLGEVGPPQAPVAMSTGDIGEEAEGTLVAVSGTVVRLESNAFWIDDGSGPARIFFRSSLGFDRPKLRRGQVWSATGIVGEFTTRVSRATGYRILVRFITDIALVSGEGVADDLTPTATSLADESATPTLVPEETNTPAPTQTP